MRWEWWRSVADLGEAKKITIEKENTTIIDGAGNKAEIWLDILNIGNMIDEDWGVIEEVGFPSMRGIVEYGGIASNGQYVYRFNTPDEPRVYDDRGVSRWALQLGFRYSF